MGAASASHTRPSLLGRLRSNPADQDAWADFVDRYGPAVYGWCRRWRLQLADAEDVTQDVLARLANKMRDFDYDPSRSFRGWLRTLTEHALSDFQKARQRQAAPGGGDGGGHERLHALAARRDLAARLDEEFDLELLEEAMGRVRLRVEPRTWEAFRLMAFEGLSGAEAAAHLRMSVATAFMVRSRVQALVAAEVRRLEGPAPGAGGE